MTRRSPVVGVLTALAVDSYLSPRSRERRRVADLHREVGAVLDLDFVTTGGVPLYRPCLARASSEDLVEWPRIVRSLIVNVIKP